MSGKPLELRLSTTQGPGLRAELVNLSPEPQPYLHDGFHQPTRLFLKGTDGKTVPSFDTRKVGKRNTAVDESMYATVDAGEADTLLEEDWVEEDGCYSLKWGPYRYENVRPGKYRAKLTWKSAKDTWVDSEAGTSGRIEHLWKGTLSSKEAEFELPALP